MENRCEEVRLWPFGFLLVPLVVLYYRLKKLSFLSWVLFVFLVSLMGLFGSLILVLNRNGYRVLDCLIVKVWILGCNWVCVLDFLDGFSLFLTIGCFESMLVVFMELNRCFGKMGIIFGT